MIFFISESKPETDNFIKNQGINNEFTRHVFSPLSLKGRPDGFLYCKVGKWFRRDDLNKIMSIIENKGGVEINFP